MSEALFKHTLSLADDALVLGHRLSEWCRFAPTHEEDLALANMGLDLIGQARALYTLASEFEDKGRNEDELAYQRDEKQFKNVLIYELPNGDFAFTMARMMLTSAFMLPYWQAMKHLKEPHLAAIAERAEKEVAYHLKHAGDWVIRLGDGTTESRARMIAALDELQLWVPELFELSEAEQELVGKGLVPDRSTLLPVFDKTVAAILRQANLEIQKGAHAQSGGRSGKHTGHLGAMLAEMQVLARRHPEAVW
jgi:ring-1,2-phenylacetyl-CoA epoxidase subunit PaaC